MLSTICNTVLLRVFCPRLPLGQAGAQLALNWQAEDRASVGIGQYGIAGLDPALPLTKEEPRGKEILIKSA